MKIRQVLFSVLVVLLSTLAYGSESSGDTAGYRHKYVLKAFSIYYKHPNIDRRVEHENINARVKELTNIDELTAFANLVDLNQKYLISSYVGPEKEYADYQELVSAMMAGWHPRVESKPVTPTPFGRRMINWLGNRNKLDFYIDLLIANDLEELREALED